MVFILNINNNNTRSLATFAPRKLSEVAWATFASSMNTKHKLLFISCFSLGIIGLALSWQAAAEWGKAGSILVLLMAQRLVSPDHVTRK